MQVGARRPLQFVINCWQAISKMLSRFVMERPHTNHQLWSRCVHDQDMRHIKQEFVNRGMYQTRVSDSSWSRGTTVLTSPICRACWASYMRAKNHISRALFWPTHRRMRSQLYVPFHLSWTIRWYQHPSQAGSPWGRSCPLRYASESLPWQWLVVRLPFMYSAYKTFLTCYYWQRGARPSDFQSDGTGPIFWCKSVSD